MIVVCLSLDDNDDNARQDFCGACLFLACVHLIRVQDQDASFAVDATSPSDGWGFGLHGI